MSISVCSMKVVTEQKGGGRGDVQGGVKTRSQPTMPEGGII